MKFKDLFGIIGALGTTFSFLPQVIRVFKNNSVEGLSPSMILIHFTGVTNWVIYGIFMHDNIIIASNGVTLFLVTLIVGKYIAVCIKNRKQSSNLPV
jgi:MtN3 and saliva related transmembrane protein